MSECINIIVGVVSAIAASASSIFAAVELRRSRKLQNELNISHKKSETLKAFEVFQTSVLDHFVVVTKEELQTNIDFIDENIDCRKAYDNTRALMARCEHFAAAINEDVYDFELVDKLGGIHIYYLYKKLMPTIEFARNRANTHNIYTEFEKLFKRFESKYKTKN